MVSWKTKTVSIVFRNAQDGETERGAEQQTRFFGQSSGDLANILARSGDGIRLNEHIEDDGPTRFTAGAFGFFILSQSGERPER
jgi:hypothetical protein